MYEFWFDCVLSVGTMATRIMTDDDKEKIIYFWKVEKELPP